MLALKKGIRQYASENKVEKLIMTLVWKMQSVIADLTRGILSPSLCKHSIPTVSALQTPTSSWPAWSPSPSPYCHHDHHHHRHHDHHHHIVTIITITITSVNLHKFTFAIIVQSFLIHKRNPIFFAQSILVLQLTGKSAKSTQIC